MQRSALLTHALATPTRRVPFLARRMREIDHHFFFHVGMGTTEKRQEWEGSFVPFLRIEKLA